MQSKKFSNSTALKKIFEMAECHERNFGIWHLRNFHIYIKTGKIKTLECSGGDTLGTFSAASSEREALRLMAIQALATSINSKQQRSSEGIARSPMITSTSTIDRRKSNKRWTKQAITNDGYGIRFNKRKRGTWFGSNGFNGDNSSSNISGRNSGGGGVDRG